MGRFDTLQAGGADTRIYEAGNPAPGVPGVVVLHAWWGLVDDVVAFADRLADAGFAVVAPDLYVGPTAATVEDAERLSGAADEARADAITLAAIDRLAGRVGTDARIGTIGFSFGAHWAAWSGAQREVIGGSVLYYGTTDGPYLAESAAPVLGHFAEDDPYESAEWVDTFAGKLRAAGREATIHRYPGTGHWFAEPSREAYVPEAADLAFERTVAFLRDALAT